MSHQVQLFLHPADVAALEQALLARRPHWVLHDRSRTGAPRRLPSLAWEESGLRWLTFYLVRPDDVGEVVLDHVPAQGYWLIDGQVSPVIEFGVCFFDGGIVRQDRAYYVDRFYAPGTDERVAKSEPFRNWAKTTFAVIKRHLRRFGSGYIGETAFALASAGQLRLIDSGHRTLQVDGSIAD